MGISLPSAQTQSLDLDTHTSHTGLETQNPIVIRTFYNGVPRLVVMLNYSQNLDSSTQDSTLTIKLIYYINFMVKVECELANFFL